MKKNYLFLFVATLIFCSNSSYAQLAGGNAYLQGHWLEIGELNTGCFGTCPGGTPAGYHSHCATCAYGNGLAEVYDYGHDGWAVGAPAYMGDYTFPGSPFEGWEIQVGTGRSQAFQQAGCPGTYASSAGFTLAGSITSYTNSGGRIIGNWTGTVSGAPAGTTLSLKQETRVDTTASWVVVTTKMYNTGATTSGVIYYMRSLDPDNDETWAGGSFYTYNSVSFQNDVDHRVEVTALSYLPARYPINLCTKDCRAVAFIYNSWPVASTVDISNFWNQVAGTSGGSYYNIHGNHNGDIALGLIYKVGALPAGDSAVVSYAYTFIGINGVDSAFPEPQLVVNGLPIAPSGPAPAPTYDTFNACGSGLTTLPVNINFASDKCWTWSSWTWSPATGLATTSGVTNTINLNALPGIITYTIVGTDSNVNMYSCNQRVMYLTIKTCNGATVNQPCLGDPLTFNAPGDSTGATYSWYGPAPSTTVVATTQSFTITPSVWADTGTYHVIKTVGAVHDTSVVLVIINPIPTLTPPISLCPGGTTTLTATPPGGTWSSSNPGVASIGASSGLVTAGVVGSTVITYVSPAGCVSTTTVTVVAIAPITGNMTVCMGSTTNLADAAGGGTWVSGATGIATIGLTTGVVTGVAAGNAPITYTIAGGCVAYATVTVTPLAPITGLASLCQRRATITLTDAVGGGTWSSSNPGIATITPTTGTVYGVTAGVATMSYTNPYGCIATYNVTINPTPPPPGVTPYSICQYWPATQLTATGAGPTFTWYGMGITAGYSPGPTPPTAVPGVDSYYVTQTSGFGCISDSALDLVTVKPKPSTPLTRDTAYCQFFASPAPLDVEVSGYTGSLNWYIGGVPLGTTAPVPSTATPTYPLGTTWYVSQTIDGCEGDSAAVNVEIIYLPNFTIAARPWVCQFDSISLAYVPSGPPLYDGSFLWQIPSASFFVNGTNQSDSMVYVQFDSSSTGNYVYLTASDLHGECSTTDTIKIDVVELPRAYAYSKADVCMSDTVSLALSSRSVSASDFVWYIDNSPLFSSPAATIIASNSNSGGPFSISWVDTGIHVIHVQAFAEHGCADNPTSDTVNVHGLPDASFRVTTLGGPLCLEDSVLFSANDSNYQNIYNWAPAHFFTETNRHDEWGRVQLAQSVVTLTITDPFGCIGSSSQELNPTVCCNVPFPNAFTPNGDGRNDVFRPFPQLREYHTYHVFRIQNRWGQTVFECTNNKAEWDGTFNGVPQDMGVYFWYLKYDCNGQTVEEKGDVTLIR